MITFYRQYLGTIFYRKSCWYSINKSIISKFNKWIRFLLCVIDIYSKYAWVIPLKDRKSITITNAIQKILDKSNCKQN